MSFASRGCVELKDALEVLLLEFALRFKVIVDYRARETLFFELPLKDFLCYDALFQSSK